MKDIFKKLCFFTSSGQKENSSVHREWEIQQTDYPQNRSGLPNHELRGCSRGAAIRGIYTSQVM